MEELNNQSMAGIEDYKRQLIENFNKSIGISEAPIPDLQKYNPKPEAADISKYVTGNPEKGSNPGAKLLNLQAHNEFIDNATNKLTRSLETNYNSDYVAMRPYTYNGDYDGANFEKYYNSKNFRQLGFSPYQDNERLYNNRSTLGDEFVRAASQWPSLFWTGVKSSVSTWGNMFTDPLSPDLKSGEEMMRAMTQGSSTKEGVGPFLVNQFLNSAYTVGIGASWLAQILALKGATKGAMALGERAGLTEATAIADETILEAQKAAENMSSLRAFFNQNKFGKAMAAAGRIVNPLDGTWQVGKQLIRGENAIGHLNGYAQWVDNFSLFAKDAIAINAAVSEARLEGGMTQMNTVKKLVDYYRSQNNGKDPDAETMAGIERQAEDEARRTAFWNLPAIMWSNKFMYETIFRPFEKGGAKLIDDVVFNPKTQAFEMVGSTLKERAEQMGKSLLSPKAYLEFSKNYLKTNLAEGIQENIQDAISTGAEEHALAIFKSPERAAYESYMGHFLDGMGRQFSAQGAETFAGGFLMGAMAGPIMAAPMKAFDSIANKTWNREEYLNRQAEKDKNTKQVVNTLNEFYKNPQLYLAPELTNVVNQTRLSQDLFTAQEEYNKKRHKDIKELSVFENVFTALQTGHYDKFINKLETYKDFTPEEAGEAFYGKKDAELGKKALQQIDNVIERAKLIKNELSDAVGSYPNPFDPSRYTQGTVEHEAAVRSYTAWNEALKNLVFAKTSFQVHSKRINEMAEAFVGKSKPIANASAQDLMVLLDPSALQTEMDLLKKEISVLSTEDKDSNKERKRKIDKLKHLENIQINVFSKEARSRMTEEQRKTTAWIENILNEKSARKSLIDYMKFLGKDSNSFVFDDKLEAALKLIGDSLLLKEEKASLVQSINVLNNPKGFFNLQNRLVKVYKQVRDNQQQILEENIKDILTKSETNAALNQFYKQYGITLPEEFLIKFYNSIKNKLPIETPTEFIDNVTKEVITSGDKFNAALEAWKRMTAEISKEAAEQYFGKEETPPPPPPPTDEEEDEEEDVTIPNKITAESDFDSLPKQLKDLLNPIYLQWAKDNELTEEEAAIPENKKKFLKENWDNIMDNHIDIRSMVNELNKNVLVTNEEEEPVSFDPANFDIKPNTQQQDAIEKLIDIVNKKIRLEEDERTYSGGKRRTSDVVEDMLVNVFKREPFYKFMDRKGDMNVKYVTDIYKASSNNIDKLISDLKAGTTLGNILSDKQFLKIKEALEKDNTFETFKKKVNELSWSGGSDRGNTIDAAIRNYFNGLPNIRPDGMTNNAFTALIDNLTALHNHFNNKGIIIVGAVQLGKRDAKIVTSNENVAGELDLIGVNENGEYEIFDIKTATDEKWENFFDEETKESALLRYTLQQSIYKKLIEDETGKKVKSINLIPIETESDTKTGFINSVKRRTKGLLVYATPGAGKSEFIRKTNQLRSEQPDNVQDMYQEFVDADRLLIDEIKKQGEAGKLPGFLHTQSDKDETVYLLNFAIYSAEKQSGAREMVYNKVANDITNLLNSGVSVMTGTIDYINSKLEADLLFVTPQFSKYSRETFDVLDPRTGKIQREEHDKEINRNPNERIEIEGPIDDQISIFSSWTIPLRYESKVEEVIIAKQEKPPVSKPKSTTKTGKTKTAKQTAVDQYNSFLTRLDDIDDLKAFEDIQEEIQNNLNIKYLTPMELLILERKLDDLENYVYNRLNITSLKYIQEMGDIIVYNNPKNPDISGQYLIETVGTKEITLRSNTSTVKVPVEEISNMRYFNDKEDVQQYTEEEIETILNNIDKINTAKRNMTQEDPNQKSGDKQEGKSSNPDNDLLAIIC